MLTVTVNEQPFGDLATKFIGNQWLFFNPKKNAFIFAGKTSSVEGSESSLTPAVKQINALITNGAIQQLTVCQRFILLSNIKILQDKKHHFLFGPPSIILDVHREAAKLFDFELDALRGLAEFVDFVESNDKERSFYQTCCQLVPSPINVIAEVLNQAFQSHRDLDPNLRAKFCYRIFAAITKDEKGILLAQLVKSVACATFADYVCKYPDRAQVESGVIINLPQIIAKHRSKYAQPFLNVIAAKKAACENKPLLDSMKELLKDNWAVAEAVFGSPDFSLTEPNTDKLDPIVKVACTNWELDPGAYSSLFGKLLLKSNSEAAKLAFIEFLMKCPSKDNRTFVDCWPTHLRVDEERGELARVFLLYFSKNEGQQKQYEQAIKLLKKVEREYLIFEAIKDASKIPELLKNLALFPESNRDKLEAWFDFAKRQNSPVALIILNILMPNDYVTVIPKTNERKE